MLCKQHQHCYPHLTDGGTEAQRGKLFFKATYQISGRARKLTQSSCAPLQRSTSGQWVHVAYKYLTRPIIFNDVHARKFCPWKIKLATNLWTHVTDERLLFGKRVGWEPPLQTVNWHSWLYITLFKRQIRNVDGETKGGMRFPCHNLSAPSGKNESNPRRGRRFVFFFFSPHVGLGINWG